MIKLHYIKTFPLNYHISLHFWKFTSRLKCLKNRQQEDAKTRVSHLETAQQLQTKHLIIQLHVQISCFKENVLQDIWQHKIYYSLDWKLYMNHKPSWNPRLLLSHNYEQSNYYVYKLYYDKIWHRLMYPQLQNKQNLPTNSNWG